MPLDFLLYDPEMEAGYWKHMPWTVLTPTPGGREGQLSCDMFLMRRDGAMLCLLSSATNSTRMTECQGLDEFVLHDWEEGMALASGEPGASRLFFRDDEDGPVTYKAKATWESAPLHARVALDGAVRACSLRFCVETAEHDLEPGPAGAEHTAFLGELEFFFSWTVDGEERHTEPPAAFIPAMLETGAWLGRGADS